MPENNFNIKGLSDEQVILAREKFGQNKLSYKKENGIVETLKNLAKEPMILLLLVASLIYFVSGKTGDGIFLSSAIILVSFISLFQDSRSRNALQKLKNLTQPNCTVIRNGKREVIKSEELVIGDSLIVEEGTSVTADGIIIHSNDFSVNESILTGESFAVFKDKSSKDNCIFKGTTIASGLAIVTITLAFSAKQLFKQNALVRRIRSIESLGMSTVICTDKTGTITENKMSLAKVFSMTSKKIETPAEANLDEKELIKIAMWASEPIPFDPMEIALHRAYGELHSNDERPYFKMVHEYPLSGRPPMMTHIFANKDGKRIIAAKGAPEALMRISNLTKDELIEIENAIKSLTNDGYRVLGVGQSNFNGNIYPKTQQEFTFEFKGIVAFYDPPKTNINKVFEDFYQAGIAVKIITGDNAETTKSIAKQIGFRGIEQSLSGEELMKLTDAALQEKVMHTNMFTRMFPEAKLRIINALKAQNQIVAMTGDGVNDGPALKAAHIGIAMGKKGTEIAKQAASLILLEDDLSKMVDAVAMGRKIYTNLKKAIQYIISIHIPIILTVFIPLALGWIYPNILSPIHIIFLELIMGPTCSIIFENEPMEKNTMLRKPRPFTNTFFNLKELTVSVIQGLAITAGTLLVYQYSVQQGFDEAHTRTMVFTVLIVANIFLTLVNRSFYYSIFTTLRYKNNLVLLIIAITIAITGLMLFVPPLTQFFEFEVINLYQLMICIGIGFASVIWYELVKVNTRVKSKRRER